jgi:DNA-binding NtrC family response regulator
VDLALRFLNPVKEIKRAIGIMKNHRDTLHGSPLSEVTAEAEKAHIIKILKSTNGNRTKAAEILAISRKTLWEKLKAFGIDFNEIDS